MLASSFLFHLLNISTVGLVGCLGDSTGPSKAEALYAALRYVELAVPFTETT